jgi:hypothetical protein
MVQITIQQFVSDQAVQSLPQLYSNFLTNFEISVLAQTLRHCSQLFFAKGSTSSFPAAAVDLLLSQAVSLLSPGFLTITIFLTST